MGNGQSESDDTQKYSKQCILVAIREDSQVRQPFPNLPSSPAASTVLGYFGMLYEVANLMQVLSHSSRSFFLKNKLRLVQFTNNESPYIFIPQKGRDAYPDPNQKINSMRFEVTKMIHSPDFLKAVKIDGNSRRISHSVSKNLIDSSGEPFEPFQGVF